MADVSEKVGQDLGKIIEAAIQIVEERLLHDDSKEALLAKAFAKENASGKRTQYKLVAEEFAEDLKKLLCDRDVPFMSTVTSTGDTLFLCTEDHADEFLRAQQDVFSLSTTMSRECTATRMAEIAGAGHDKRLVTLSLSDERMAMIAQQELYENDVVCSVNNFRDEDVPGSPDLNARMYISTASVYAPYKTKSKPVRDLASAEFKLALIQTMGDLNPIMLETRKTQAKYDHEMLEKFAKIVESGHGEAYLANDEELSAGKYLAVKDGVVLLHQVRNGKEESTEIKIGKDATLQEIRATLSRHGLSIRNKVMFESEKAFVDAIPYDVDKIKNEFEGKVPENMAVSERMVSVMKIKDDVRNGLYDLTDAISKEASAYVDRAYPHKSNTQKYELKKARMAEIANMLASGEQVPGIDVNPEFLDDRVAETSSMRVKDYLKFAIAHFEDTHEKQNDEITVDIEVVNKKLKDRIAIEESLDKERVEKFRKTEEAEREAEREDKESAE